MKNRKIKWMLTLVATFFLAACNTDVEHNVPAVDAPIVVSTTPEAGTAKLKAGEITILVNYDKNIFFATKNLSQIVFTGGELISADVFGSSHTLTVKVKVTKRGELCTLSIPEGVVLGPNSTPAPALSLQFSTTALDKTLVNASAIPAAQKVYAYLLDNFEKKTLSAMMANVNWNTEESEKVYRWTGKYPAINCFDYVHLFASGQNWINYNDITPVKEWWNAGGLVAAMWHWNVPATAPVSVISKEIWKGEQVMPGDWSGSVQMNNEVAKAVFSEAQVGNKIRVTVKDIAAGAQGSFKNGNWGEIAPGTDYFDISGNYELEITEDVLASLKEGGLIIGGHDYTATGVYLESGSAGTIDYAFYKDKTAFNADNALVEGTWENKVFTEDLAKIAGCLKLLQEEGIPVIWRPFHEAAGGWFWWGKNATSFKAMWMAMFNYFKEQGLNNLIWVWTTEGNDAEWYPGDAYVDIVGRDLYGQNTQDCASQYASIAGLYGNKMITLSECGYSETTSAVIGKISEQWTAGARWSWFMPWYDGADATALHSGQDWWQDAMKQDFVISRADVPSMK